MVEVSTYRWSEGTTRLDGDTRLVVGLVGSQGVALDSLGLLLAR